MAREYSMDLSEKLAAFAVLMEHGEGILGKAPSYIKEKWILCETSRTREHLEQLMDRDNRAKFHDWLVLWGAHLK